MQEHQEHKGNDMAEERQVQLFDTVCMSYTAKAPGGEVIAEAPEDAPIAVAIGSGQLLLAAEAAMLGMKAGETREVAILPEDAFGVYDPGLRQDIPRAVFGDRIDPKPGMLLSLSVERDGQTQPVPATVLAADQETVTVDYNHPLAGKTITYTVRLHSIGN